MTNTWGIGKEGFEIFCFSTNRVNGSLRILAVIVSVLLLGYVGWKAYITSDIYKEFNGIDSATASLLFSRKTVATNARDKTDLGGIIKPLSLKKDNSSSIACVIKTNHSSDCGNNAVMGVTVN